MLEEQFFIWYNYGTPPWESNRLMTFDRKWFIERFVQQKERENEAHERAMQKSKTKR